MITSVSADDLIIENRQRQEFKEQTLQDLANSILRVGLIHAPVVASGKLVAGERRIRALALTEGKRFKYGSEEYSYPRIPVHLIPSDDPKLLYEIELEENLRRVNLNPMEEANAIAKLHQLKVEENPKQTAKDTAQELAKIENKPKATGADETRTANSILVDSFKNDPEVQKAAKISLNRAAKVARKKMEIDLVKGLQALEDSKEEKTPQTNSMFKIIPGDAISILKDYPSKSFNVLCFDPPYGVNADKFGEAAMDLGHQYKDDWDYAYNLVVEILTHSQRVMDEVHSVLMFCSYDKYEEWKNLYKAYGYNVWPRPIIWSKGQQAHAPLPDYGPRYSYECVLYAMKGKKKINRLINDVINIPAVRDKIHAAEKPVELFSELLTFVASPGDRVLDPCTGSGNIFLAAVNKEIYVTGIELNSDYYAIAKEKIRA